MPGKPDLREALHVPKGVRHHSRHQRPAAKMRMDREVNHRRRLSSVEEVKSVFINLVEVSGTTAEHPIIGEVAVGNRNQRPLGCFQPIGKVGIVVIAMP